MHKQKIMHCQSADEQDSVVAYDRVCFRTTWRKAEGFKALSIAAGKMARGEDESLIIVSYGKDVDTPEVIDIYYCHVEA